MDRVGNGLGRSVGILLQHGKDGAINIIHGVIPPICAENPLENLFWRGLPALKMHSISP
jgi:sorbitol-specific phosphotransferase system component IIBC